MMNHKGNHNHLVPYEDSEMLVVCNDCYFEERDEPQRDDDDPCNEWDATDKPCLFCGK